MSPKPLKSLQRTEWRARADDPESLFGWWIKGTFRKRNLRWLFLLPVLGSAYVGLLGAGWWPLAMSLVAWGVVRTFRVNEWDPLRALLPDPPPPGQFRALVAYRQNGVQTGTDEMALTVVDGWLYAEGVRSHFALRREDVRDLRTGSDRQGRLALSDGSEVALAGIGDDARIVLERWWQSKALGGGAPTFPPARVHPQELARWNNSGLIASIALVCLPSILNLLPKPSWALRIVGDGFGAILIALILYSIHRQLRLIKLIRRERADAERSQKTFAAGQALPHQEAGPIEVESAHVV